MSDQLDFPIDKMQEAIDKAAAQDAEAAEKLREALGESK